jgi:hypothetical protein
MTGQAFPGKKSKGASEKIFQQRVLLEEEGLSFRTDGTIDLNRYQWRPGLEIIRILSLPEEIAFQINLKVPYLHP